MSFRGLTVYQKGFQLAMEIFSISKDFPGEERYSLTDQIRRSSRSVCVTLGEAYRKRQHEKYFVNKVSDSDMENTETQVWIDFAFECGYISTNQKADLLSRSEEVGKLLNHMMNNPEKYRRKSDK